MQSTVQSVTLAALERHVGIVSEVNKVLLVTCGLIRSAAHPVKILATGSLTKKLSFTDIELYSAHARQAIEKAGGTCTV